MSTTTLSTSYRLAPLEPPNRIVMAPMTRNRAGEGNALTELNASYYAQRAALGLLVAEGTQPTAMGQLDTGHFALEEDDAEIAANIRRFLLKNVTKEDSQ